MDLSQWAMPAGLGVAGTGAVLTAGLLLGHRRRTGEQSATAEERAELALQRRHALQRRMAVIALSIGCLMMFVLAGIAAWLSFGAQREYAHAHNGGDWDAATGFALLLDAGALSLSLIRFFEALTLRSSALTRILLLAFVSASAVMNLLHAPGAGAGSAFLAMVPPLVYAILLEMLLFKVEQVIMGPQKRPKADRERGYSLLLWLPWPIGAPVQMWKAWRSELLATIDNVRVTGSLRPLPRPAEPVAATATAPVRMTLERTGTGRLPAVHPAVPETALTSSANALPAPVQPPVVEDEPASAPATAVATAPLAAADPDVRATAEQLPEAASATAGRGPVAEPEAAADHGEHLEVAPGEVPSSTAGRDETEAERPTADASAGREPETRHDHPAPERGRGEVSGERGPQIDLSTLPEDEGPRQLAERIYVAHQVAGLPLDKVDLAQWAGYTNPRSGGNEYRRLVREYGPIQKAEGASFTDLDWSSLDRQDGPASSHAAA